MVKGEGILGHGNGFLFAIVIVDDSIEHEQSAPMTWFPSMYRYLVCICFEVNPQSTIRETMQVVRSGYGIEPLILGYIGQNTGFISMNSLKRSVKLLELCSVVSIKGPALIIKNIQLNIV